MAQQLEEQLRGTMWLPRDRREVMPRGTSIKSAVMWGLELGEAWWLAQLGRNWTSVEGDLESVAATVPDTWFARAMPVIEKRR
ncbi:MAG: hypothetical protein Q8N23_36030 [Archangium sp.]|nr:hypothetical protein [Archangium sp.]MDP3158137.1 hypothetical protein [Archangium sp.]MDP3570456.1 hypothetical protein [Archangium sp.]